MKKIITVVLFGFVSSKVFACDKGCTEYKGNCACDIIPVSQAPSVQPTAEKPSRHPEPAWQRGDVKIVDIPSFKTEADEADAQINFAKKRSQETK